MKRKRKKKSCLFVENRSVGSFVLVLLFCQIAIVEREVFSFHTDTRPIIQWKRF